ncbi:MAG: hypothetical protein ABH828_02265 [archaeon]
MKDDKKLSLEEVMGEIDKLREENVDLREEKVRENPKLTVLWESQKLYFQSWDVALGVRHISVQEIIKEGEKRDLVNKATKRVKFLEKIVDAIGKGVNLNPNELVFHDNPYHHLLLEGKELFEGTNVIEQAVNIAGFNYTTLKETEWPLSIGELAEIFQSWGKKKLSVNEEDVRKDLERSKYYADIMAITDSWDDFVKKAGIINDIKWLHENNIALDYTTVSKHKNPAVRKIYSQGYGLEGGWERTVESAGFIYSEVLIKRKEYTDEELFEIFREAENRGEKLDTGILKRNKELSKFKEIIYKRFGSYFTFLEEAGLNPDKYRQRISKSKPQSTKEVESTTEKKQFNFEPSKYAKNKQTTKEKGPKYKHETKVYKRMLNMLDKKGYDLSTEAFKETKFTKNVLATLTRRLKLGWYEILNEFGIDYTKHIRRKSSAIIPAKSSKIETKEKTTLDSQVSDSYISVKKHPNWSSLKANEKKILLNLETYVIIPGLPLSNSTLYKNPDKNIAAIYHQLKNNNVGGMKKLVKKVGLEYVDMRRGRQKTVQQEKGSIEKIIDSKPSEYTRAQLRARNDLLGMVDTVLFNTTVMSKHENDDVKKAYYRVASAFGNIETAVNSIGYKMLSAKEIRLSDDKIANKKLDKTQTQETTDLETEVNKNYVSVNKHPNWSNLEVIEKEILSIIEEEVIIPGYTLNNKTLQDNFPSIANKIRNSSVGGMKKLIKKVGLEYVELKKGRQKKSKQNISEPKTIEKQEITNIEETVTEKYMPIEVKEDWNEYTPEIHSMLTEIDNLAVKYGITLDDVTIKSEIPLLYDKIEKSSVGNLKEFVRLGGFKKPKVKKIRTEKPVEQEKTKLESDVSEAYDALEVHSEWKKYDERKQQLFIKVEEKIINQGMVLSSDLKNNDDKEIRSLFHKIMQYGGLKQFSTQSGFEYVHGLKGQTNVRNKSVTKKTIQTATKTYSHRSYTMTEIGDIVKVWIADGVDLKKESLAEDSDKYRLVEMIELRQNLPWVDYAVKQGANAALLEEKLQPIDQEIFDGIRRLADGGILSKYGISKDLDEKILENYRYRDIAAFAAGVVYAEDGVVTKAMMNDKRVVNNLKEFHKDRIYKIAKEIYETLSICHKESLTNKIKETEFKDGMLDFVIDGFIEKPANMPLEKFLGGRISVYKQNILAEIQR